MLVNPERADFALRWHRDDVRENATTSEEREALAKWQYGVSTCLQNLTVCINVPERVGSVEYVYLLISFALVK